MYFNSAGDEKSGNSGCFTRICEEPKDLEKCRWFRGERARSVILQRLTFKSEAAVCRKEAEKKNPVRVGSVVNYKKKDRQRESEREAGVRGGGLFSEMIQTEPRERRSADGPTARRPDGCHKYLPRDGNPRRIPASGATAAAIKT